MTGHSMLECYGRTKTENTACCPFRHCMNCQESLIRFPDAVNPAVIQGWGEV